MAVQAERGGEPPLAGRERPSDLDQTNARIAPAQRGDDAQQDVDALAPDRAAHVQELETTAVWRTEKRDGFSIRARIGSRPVRRMHAVRYHDDPFGGNDRGRHQRVARGQADAQDLSRRAHALEQPAAERPFDDRAAFGPGSTPRKASRSWQVTIDRPGGSCCARCA